MKKKVFYSWQSDLPNNTNRGFIQKCLEKAIDKVAKDQLDIDPVLDRDTQGTSGSPEIVSTIFSKIDKAHIYVADISIINKDDAGRKTPNPNVMLELGYAAKTLGWDHIITILNTDTGRIEELPFDVRARRPIIYSTTGLINAKKGLQQNLERSIISILGIDTPTETVRLHLKQKIDSIFLAIYHNLYRICVGYRHRKYAHYDFEILGWDKNKIEQELFEKKILGFFLFKDNRYIADQFEQVLFSPAFGNLFDIRTQQLIVKMINSINTFQQVSGSLSTYTGPLDMKHEYRVADGARYYPATIRKAHILGAVGNDGLVRTVDHGVMIYPITQEQFKGLFRIKTEEFNFFVDVLWELLATMKSYYDYAGLLVDYWSFNYHGIDDEE